MQKLTPTQQKKLKLERLIELNSYSDITYWHNKTITKNPMKLVEVGTSTVTFLDAITSVTYIISKLNTDIYSTFFDYKEGKELTALERDLVNEEEQLFELDNLTLNKVEVECTCESLNLLRGAYDKGCKYHGKR